MSWGLWQEQKPGLTIPVAQVGVVSEPSAPLPAKIALPPDAGSFALAINGAARCWATSGPAVVSVPGQLLCGVRSQSRVMYPRGVIHPTEDLSASCIWSGFLYSCPPRPPFIHIIVFQLAIHPLLVLGSLRGKTKDNSQKQICPFPKLWSFQPLLGILRYPVECRHPFSPAVPSPFCLLDGCKVCD
ncbi:hypothetical protein mRhiFer1_008322 [Rhinolophus ferrumequinum]|uniref:Uncharacterized protein n=1 Tax=Rhinolophus ferrumequinum TaxID=59479 RepID=A0A7J7VRL8_RHIFE|nr:hypothetical protein mRhiFer1_008322 [Rhinolophus ferrumequinum]